MTRARKKKTKQKNPTKSLGSQNFFKKKNSIIKKPFTDWWSAIPHGALTGLVPEWTKTKKFFKKKSNMAIDCLLTISFSCCCLFPPFSSPLPLGPLLLCFLFFLLVAVFSFLFSLDSFMELRHHTDWTGVTILLSLTVFLNLVAETLPQVSDAIPLLGSPHTHTHTHRFSSFFL